MSYRYVKVSGNDQLVAVKRQGKDEEIAYRFDFTEDGTPSAAAVAIFVDGVDVTATNMPGVSSISGDYVITPPVIDLLPGKQYRLECLVTISGNKFEPYILINANQ